MIQFLQQKFRRQDLFFLPLFVAFLLFLSSTSVAQPPGADDIEARRIGFITHELQLTPDEAKVFWPVYNKYNDEMNVLRKDRATELLSAKINFDSMSDDEVSKLIDNELNSRQKEIDIQRKYTVEFKKVLPVKKVAKLYRAEQMFKISLIKDMKQGPMQQGQGNQPPPMKRN